MTVRNQISNNGCLRSLTAGISAAAREPATFGANRLQRVDAACLTYTRGPNFLFLFPMFPRFSLKSAKVVVGRVLLYQASFCAIRSTLMLLPVEKKVEKLFFFFPLRFPSDDSPPSNTRRPGRYEAAYTETSPRTSSRPSLPPSLPRLRAKCTISASPGPGV